MRKAIIVAGLSFGDEGKGSVVDYLARRHDAELVVRYNGGAQAAHHVVLPDGRVHCFSQFGSGAFTSGCETHLSRDMVVNPIAFIAERRRLRKLGIVQHTVTVDGDALLTTPYHIALNRLRELMRDNRHGSCGMGVGETVDSALTQPANEVVRAADLNDELLCYEKLHLLRRSITKRARHVVGKHTSPAIARELLVIEDSHRLEEIYELFMSFRLCVQIVDRSWLRLKLNILDTAIFEGAHGVLLHENSGFQPYTTWADTSFKNADDLIGDCGAEVYKLGVLRAYGTRHGPGPFVTEDVEAKHLSVGDHNTTGEWQGAFRTGWFDFVAAKYALQVVGSVDGLAITCLDRLGGDAKACEQYAGDGSDPAFFEGDSTAVHTIVHDQPDYKHQEALSKKLFAMKPVYTQVKSAKLLNKIADTLAPIALLSNGPTHANKTVLDDYL